MQIWAGSEKSALPICNYSQILYQFLTFTQNLKRSRNDCSLFVAVIGFAMAQLIIPAYIYNMCFWQCQLI